jgi:phospholipase C
MRKTVGYGPAVLAGVLFCVTSASGTAQARNGAGISKIDHIVIVVQENRSFDNLFRGFPNAHSTSTGKLPNGKAIALKRVSLAAFYDISHSLQDGKTSYDRGKMDGFANEYSSGAGSGDPYPQYAYVPQSEVQPYWDMAQQYVLGDRMFASQLDGSYIAHQYLIAGWAGRAYNYPSALPWGCDSPSTNSIGLLDSAGQPSGVTFPCFTYPTIADELDAKGISWRYYAPSTGLGYSWSAYDAISKIRNGPDWKKDIVSPETRIVGDVAKGVLADVTWVVPSLALSDHAGSRSKRGPSWVASVVNAIGGSKFWNSTAIFVTWDDWGGWYDDVAPPQLDFDGLGIRVPLICISPFAKSNYVDHTRYEFGSLLAFVEARFGLPSLGHADARAAQPQGCFDFQQPPRAFVKIKAPYDPSDVVRHASKDAPDEQ